ncbi:MAG: hypothetical protein QM725_13005 [Lacibacter sp.]
MIAEPGFPRIKFPVAPEPPEEDEREELPNRTLHSLYVKGENRYVIDCISLSCKTILQFSNAELGDVFFERKSELFIRSTKPVEDDYMKFLKRAVQQWKNQFAHL